MKKKLLFLVVLLCSMAATVTTSYAQDTDFWFAPPHNYTARNYDGNGGFVFTNTTNRTATINVHFYKSNVDSVITIGPNGGYHMKMSDAAVKANIAEAHVITGGTIAGRVIPGGVHITSNEKIIVYYLYDIYHNKDIYVLKGKTSMGTDYYVPQSEDGYFINGGGGMGGYHIGTRDQVNIMATEDGTTVSFNIPRDCHQNGEGVGVYTANPSPAAPYTVTMNKGEVFTLMETIQGTLGSFNTLGGTHISSNKKIVVSSGEDFTDWDMIGDQLVPSERAGTLFPLIKGYSTGNPMDKVYIIAIKDGTVVDVIEPGGGSAAGFPQTLNAGQITHYNLGNDGTPPYAATVSSAVGYPVLVMHATADIEHPAGSIVPSIFSVSQNRFSFYQMIADHRGMMVVFKDDCDTTFQISYGSVSEPLIDPVTLAVASGVTIDTKAPVPGIAGWSYMRVKLPSAADGRVVTISNWESPFSLSYYSGSPSSLSSLEYCVYGYLSGFGDWEFDPDTIWRCANSKPYTLMGGYARQYKWILPDSTIKQGTNLVTMKARTPGMYVLMMDQDKGVDEQYWTVDSCWVLDMVFNATIKRQPPKPAKIGVPQVFSSTVNTDLPNLSYEWTFEGGTPSTSQSATPKVVWNTTGQKKVTLKLTSWAQVGKEITTCDTTLILDLMLHEKNIGYFVDKDRVDGNHDGTNWENAFQQVYEALDSASQGDCIWVAEGTYQPKADGKSFVMDYDSVEMYGGFGGWEANINERDVASHQTILSGRGSNVVTFDGSNSYTSGSCGVSRATRLDGFIVQDGEATDGAGITFINGASGTVAYCIIKRNTATGNGGGIYIGGTYGGCEIGSEDPLLVNNEVSGNRAALGAGIYNNGSKFLSVNNTIAGNSSKGASGLYNEGDADLRNTIIWGNLTDGALGKDVTNGNGTPVYSYCNISGWSTALGQDGTHNIDKNPVFLRKGYSDDYTMREGNYQLSNGSPSVDKGRNAYVLADLPNRISTVLLKPVDAKYGEGLTFDLAGLNRIENDIVDMGAYEFHPDTTFQSLVHEVVIGTYPNMTTEPAAGIHQAIAHSNFTMTLTPDAGYSLNYITITTGSDYQDNQGAMVVMHNPDGTVTVVFKEVSDPLNVKINGISPTASEAIEGVSTLWANGGNLYVQVAKASQLSIYTVTGQLYRQQTIGAGETVIPLAQGVYVVTVDNGTKQKIVIK